jgi:hypothetical protein
MTDRRVSQILWNHTPENVFRVDLTQSRADQLQALLLYSVPFESICRINYGAQISSREPGGFRRERYLGTDPLLMSDPKRFYEGAEMRPFGMRWRGMYLDWHPDVIYGPRTSSLFENNKLSVRKISGDADTFVAWVDEGQFYTDDGVIHAVPYHFVRDEPSYAVSEHQARESLNYDLFYLLGVVMSSSVLEYYAELFATGSLQGAFSHVYPNTVKALPIPKLDAPLGEAPSGWLEEARRCRRGASVDGAALRRTFGERHVAAAVVATCARRRQELESELDRREKDFRDFLLSQGVEWRWGRNESLVRPPSEEVFLVRVGSTLTELGVIASVRDTFLAETQAAQTALADGSFVNEVMNDLSAYLFTLPLDGMEG